MDLTFQTSDFYYQDGYLWCERCLVLGTSQGQVCKVHSLSLSSMHALAKDHYRKAHQWS